MIKAILKLMGLAVVGVLVIVIIYAIYFYFTKINVVAGVDVFRSTLQVRYEVVDKEEFLYISGSLRHESAPIHIYEIDIKEVKNKVFVKVHVNSMQFEIDERKIDFDLKIPLSKNIDYVQFGRNRMKNIIWRRTDMAER